MELVFDDQPKMIITWNIKITSSQSTNTTAVTMRQVIPKTYTFTMFC